MKKMGIFSECFVENDHICKKLNFMLSKGFVNIKTVLQNHCTQCLYRSIKKVISLSNISKVFSHFYYTLIVYVLLYL